MKNDNGWIKLHRKIVDWEWYKDSNVFKVFMHLLLTSSHKDTKYRGEDIKMGSRVIGRLELAKEIGISEQSLRTALTKLKSTSELTIKSNNKYSVVSINKYIEYQGFNQLANQRLTNNQPTTNHIQEYREDKNIKKDIYISPEKIKEISNKYKVSEISVEEIYQDLIIYCKSKGKTYKDYEAALMGWVRRGLKEGKLKVQQQNNIPEVETISEEQRMINLDKINEIKMRYKSRLHL